MDITRFLSHLQDPQKKQVDLMTMRENAIAKNAIEHIRLAENVLNQRFPNWQFVKSRRVGSKPTDAMFLGKVMHFDTARAAYIWLVERIAEVNPTLFTDVRWETTGYVGVGRRRNSDGAARNYFAKSPAKLFRQTPTLAESPSNFYRLTNGWYVNLNLNTRENFEILCRFSRVSGLTHNQDWDWAVIEPTEQLHNSRCRTQLATKLQKEIDEFLGQQPSTDA